ncbi:MAG: hypothetical protein H7145_14760 [Akkermansiaceae bacterium]|nr:hypothetical protein [Armatimonadota bacterium]
MIHDFFGGRGGDHSARFPTRLGALGWAVFAFAVLTCSGALGPPVRAAPPAAPSPIRLPFPGSDTLLRLSPGGRRLSVLHLQPTLGKKKTASKAPPAAPEYTLESLDGQGLRPVSPAGGARLEVWNLDATGHPVSVAFRTKESDGIVSYNLCWAGENLLFSVWKNKQIVRDYDAVERNIGQPAMMRETQGYLWKPGKTVASPFAPAANGDMVASPDGRTLAVRGTFREVLAVRAKSAAGPTPIVLYRMPTGERIRTVTPGGSGGFEPLFLSGDGNMLFALAERGDEWSEDETGARGFPTEYLIGVDLLTGKMVPLAGNKESDRIERTRGHSFQYPRPVLTADGERVLFAFDSDGAILYAAVGADAKIARGQVYPRRPAMEIREISRSGEILRRTPGRPGSPPFRGMVRMRREGEVESFAPLFLEESGVGTSARLLSFTPSGDMLFGRNDLWLLSRVPGRSRSLARNIFLREVTGFGAGGNLALVQYVNYLGTRNAPLSYSPDKTKLIPQDAYSPETHWGLIRL